MTWRSVGGVLDFYVFTGPSAEDVVQQYVQTVGKLVVLGGRMGWWCWVGGWVDGVGWEDGLVVLGGRMGGWCWVGGWVGGVG